MSGSRLAFGSVTPSKSKIKDGAQPLGDASQKVSAKALLLVRYNSTPRYNCTPDARHIKAHTHTNTHTYSLSHTNINI